MFIKRVWTFRSCQIPVHSTTTEKGWLDHLSAQWAWGSDTPEFCLSHLLKTKYKCYVRSSLSMFLASLGLHPVHPLFCAQFLSWIACMDLKIQSTELHWLLVNFDTLKAREARQVENTTVWMMYYETKSPLCLSIGLP